MALGLHRISSHGAEAERTMTVARKERVLCDSELVNMLVEVGRQSYARGEKRHSWSLESDARFMKRMRQEGCQASSEGMARKPNVAERVSFPYEVVHLLKLEAINSVAMPS